MSSLHIVDQGEKCRCYLFLSIKIAVVQGKAKWFCVFMKTYSVLPLLFKLIFSNQEVNLILHLADNSMNANVMKLIFNLSRGDSFNHNWVNLHFNGFNEKTN